MFKRCFALLISVFLILAMGISVCSAAEGNMVKRHDLIVTDSSPSSPEMDSLKQMLTDFYAEQGFVLSSPDDVDVYLFEKLSNGTYLFKYSLPDTIYPGSMVTEVISPEYSATYTSGCPFHIFDGAAFFGLKEAYEKGVVDDEVMDELVASYPSFTKEAPESEPESEPETESADPMPATVDQATSDSVIPGGPAINTGAAFSGLAIFLMVESIIVVIVYRRKLSQVE